MLGFNALMGVVFGVMYFNAKYNPSESAQALFMLSIFVMIAGNSINILRLVRREEDLKAANQKLQQQLDDLRGDKNRLDSHDGTAKVVSTI